MEKWEYKIVTVEAILEKFIGSRKMPDSFVEELDCLGEDGWELINIIPLTMNGPIITDYSAVLKRKKK